MSQRGDFICGANNLNYTIYFISEEDIMSNVTDIFGSLVFNDTVMKERLSDELISRISADQSFLVSQAETVLYGVCRFCGNK